MSSLAELVRRRPSPWLMPLLWFSLAVYLAGTAAVTLVEARQRRAMVLAEIDRNLTAGALGIEHILPDDFHDRGVRADAIAAAEDDGNIRHLTEHARHTGFRYLYACVLDGDLVRLTTSSESPEEEVGHTGTRFWQEYGDAAEGLRQVLRHGGVRHESYTDRWGTYRGVFIQRTTPGGRAYAVCADLDLTQVEAQLGRAEAGSYAFGATIALFGIALVLVVRWALRRLTASRRGFAVLAQVAQASGRGVVIAGPDRRVVWANEAFAQIAGREAAPGTLLRELVAGAGDAAAGVDAALAGGTAISFELAGAGGRWLLADLQPAAGSGDWILALKDITERKALEDDLRRARAAAEAASAAKSAFLANMSHEIRTPMNGVLGMTELLLASRLPPNQTELARTIYHSAESLLGLLNDLLDVSKIEAGQMVLDPTPTDLERIVYDVADLFRHRLAGGEVELLVRIAPGTPCGVLADPLRLRQIIANLVGNAVKFTRHGHILVEVSGTAGPDGRIALVIAVEDTGVGIPADRIGALFRPFVQAEAGTARTFGGTGLGLSICRTLARMMDGDVTVRSETGKGSVFTVTLAVPLAALPAPAPADAGLAGANVLAVDDNPVNRRIIAEQLAAAGAVCRVVADAGEALAELVAAAAAGAPFGLCLIDQRMPGMDGLDLADAIRAEPACGKPALVLYTSDPVAAPGALAEAHGFAGCLTKPARGETLVGVLAAARDGRSSRLIAALGQVEPVPGEAAVLREHGLRILLAEDNPVNQQVALGMLERLGCRVEVAADGAAAAAAWERGGHDLILMDCMMPGVDGYQATARIRAAEAGAKRIPIIAMTANAMAGDRERCIAAGMDDHLAKPMTIAELDRVLARWTRRP